MTSQNVEDVRTSALPDRSIGDIIAEANKLTAEQVEQILAHQRAGSALRRGRRLARPGWGEDVLWALSQQFHYPYAGGTSPATSDELVLAAKPFSDQAEAFRTHAQPDQHAPLSGRRSPARARSHQPEQGDGKTFFAANLAIAFSQLGGRTLLVDADLRNPRQHEILGWTTPAQRAGWGILSGRSEANVIRPSETCPASSCCPSGRCRPTPPNWLSAPPCPVDAGLVSKFDYVIVDTWPPLWRRLRRDRRPLRCRPGARTQEPGPESMHSSRSSGR